MLFVLIPLFDCVVLTLALDVPNCGGFLSCTACGLRTDCAHRVFHRSDVLSRSVTEDVFSC